MENFYLKFSKKSAKDIALLLPKLKRKLFELLDGVISKNPYLGKKLTGDLDGDYSYRLNIKDRIVYSINKTKKEVHVKRVKTHYRD